MTNVERNGLTNDVVCSILDSFPDPTLLLSPDRRVRHLNRACRRAFGTGEESLGIHCFELLHHQSAPCDRFDGECPVASSMRTGQPARTLHVHYRDGAQEHQHVSVYPLGPVDGEPRGFLGVLQSVRAASATPRPDRLYGHSLAFNRMLELMHRVAETELPVLVIGESGTGKGLVAEAIHRMSGRRGGPFVRTACSGIEEELLRVELFGHEPGAFPGAFGRTSGTVGSAAGGTLLLDEVGDLPPLLQVELLRLLETGSYRRFGGSEPVRADVRLIVATHLDLPVRIGQGAFRADLYNRISAFPIGVPPLRERRDDLEELIELLLDQIAHPRIIGLDPEALALLERYPFPGNIHELRNMLERASLLALGNLILPEHLPGHCRPPPTQLAGLPPATAIVPLSEIEALYVRWAAGAFPGDKATLAKKLGIGERTLYRKLRQLREPEGGTEEP